MSENSWHRNATNTGDQKSEAYISQQLRQRWSAPEYPVHIDVIGDRDSTAVWVKVWDHSGLEIIEKAYPEDHLGANAATAPMRRLPRQRRSSTDSRQVGTLGTSANYG
jgi:hypothetical protein